MIQTHPKNGENMAQFLWKPFEGQLTHSFFEGSKLKTFNTPSDVAATYIYMCTCVYRSKSISIYIYIHIYLCVHGWNGQSKYPAHLDKAQVMVEPKDLDIHKTEIAWYFDLLLRRIKIKQSQDNGAGKGGILNLLWILCETMTILPRNHQHDVFPVHNGWELLSFWEVTGFLSPWNCICR